MSTRDNLIEIFVRVLKTSTDNATSLVKNEGKWDSVVHVNLIYECEEFFDIEFSLDQIDKVDSFSSLLETIEANLE